MNEGNCFLLLREPPVQSKSSEHHLKWCFCKASSRSCLNLPQVTFETFLLPCAWFRCCEENLSSSASSYSHNSSATVKIRQRSDLADRLSLPIRPWAYVWTSFMFFHKPENVSFHELGVGSSLRVNMPSYENNRVSRFNTAWPRYTAKFFPPLPLTIYLILLHPLNRRKFSPPWQEVK